MYIVYVSILLLVNVECKHRQIIQISDTRNGVSVYPVYLDPNSNNMIESGIFTRSDVDLLRKNVVVFAALFLNVDVNGTVDKNGVMSGVDGIVFPYHVEYKLINDTKYPERVSVWSIDEYGFMIKDKDMYAQYGYYVYINKENKDINEIMTSVSFSFSNMTEITSNIDDNNIMGMSKTIYTVVKDTSIYSNSTVTLVV